MKRRRRGEPSDTTEPALPPELQVEGAEPQIDVRMRGGADAVKKQLGVATEEKKPEKKPEDNGHDTEKKKFVEALRNSKYIIRVKRLTPREVNGYQTNVEVWQTELPLSYQEIVDEVTKSYLGGKYRVAVIDPASNSTVAADTFEVPGDPLLPEGATMSQEEQNRILMRGTEKSAADLTEEGLDRRARTSAKMLEVEALEAQLDEARQRRMKPAEKPFVQDNTRVDDLERRLTEAKHQAELESRDRKHAEEMRELKALIAQNSKPVQQGPSEVTLLIQQMQKNQESSDKRFEAMQKQMQDDKLNALLEEVKAIKNRPAKESGTMLETAEAMLKMKKLFSWGDDDDDDDDDGKRDPNDTRPWYERALDKLGDKFIPRLIDKLDGMEEGGKKVTREDFMRELQLVAKQTEDEAVARAQDRITKLGVPGLPAPPQVGTVPAAIPPPPNPPVPGAFQAPKAPVSELPPPPPSAPAATPPASPVPATPPSAPAGMSLQQEILLRVGGVLEILSREIELRPGEYLWNYEGVWQSAPEDIRERIAAAPDPVAMIDAFGIPGITPELLADLKAKVAANPKIIAWLQVGLDELKEWTAEKAKDPGFDPFADEEEGT